MGATTSGHRSEATRETEPGTQKWPGLSGPNYREADVGRVWPQERHGTRISVDITYKTGRLAQRHKDRRKANSEQFGKSPKRRDKGAYTKPGNRHAGRVHNAVEG